MQKLLLTSLFFLAVFFAFAQENPTYQWANTVGKKPNETLDFVIQKEDKSIVVVKNLEDSKTQFSLDFLDSNYVFVGTKSLELKVDKIEEYATIKNQVVVFATVYNTAENKDLLNAYIYDGNGEFKKSITLFTQKANGGYHNDFDVSVSPNHKFIAVSASAAYQEKQKEYLHHKLFNDEFKELSSQDLLTSIESSKRRINVMVCNNDGFSYLIKRDRVKAKNEYYLFTFSPSGSNENASIRLKIRDIADMEYTLDAAGSLYIAGCYTNALIHNFEGVFIGKFEASAKSSFLKEYGFNENVIDAFKSKKDIKDFGYGLDLFKVEKLLSIKDKNLILTLEHHSVLRDSKGGAEDLRTGIVVINFDNFGGFLYATPYLTHQTDGKTMGYWSSNESFDENGSSIVYLNKIGEGAKKLTPQTGAGLSVERIAFDAYGTATISNPQFRVKLQNYALNSNIKNQTGLQIICLENIERTSYTIGVLKENNE